VWGDAFCVGKCEEAKVIFEDKLAVSTSSEGSNAGPCPTALLSGAASGSSWVWSSHGTHPIASPKKTKLEGGVGRTCAARAVRGQASSPPRVLAGSSAAISSCRLARSQIGLF